MATTVNSPPPLPSQAGLCLIYLTRQRHRHRVLRAGNTIVDDENCLPDTQCTQQQDLLTYMIYADDPKGPWSEPVLVPSPEAWDTVGSCCSLVTVRTPSLFNVSPLRLRPLGV